MLAILEAKLLFRIEEGIGMKNFGSGRFEREQTLALGIRGRHGATACGWAAFARQKLACLS